MAPKTWFLPPDFTYLPTSEISLGAVIPSPNKPTSTLALLATLPDIKLPAVTTLHEKDRRFSSEKSRSFGAELLAQFLDLADANVSSKTSWHKNKSFSATDHEIRTFGGPLSEEAVSAALAVDRVKRHVESGRFGKRSVYIITGIRVANESFEVTDEKGFSTDNAAGGGGPAGPAPVTLRGGVSGATEDKVDRGYSTAPGIVFAYRLHVVRPRSGGDDVQLFSQRSAFFSGDPDAAYGEDEEVEMAEADGDTLADDFEMEPGSYEARAIEGQEEGFVFWK